MKITLAPLKFQDENYNHESNQKVKLRTGSAVFFLCFPYTGKLDPFPAWPPA